MIILMFPARPGLAVNDAAMLMTDVPGYALLVLVVLMMMILMVVLMIMMLMFVLMMMVLGFKLDWISLSMMLVDIDDGTDTAKSARNR